MDPRAGGSDSPPMCAMNGDLGDAELESMCGGEDVHVRKRMLSKTMKWKREAPNWGPKPLKPHWVSWQREVGGQAHQTG